MVIVGASVLEFREARFAEGELIFVKLAKELARRSNEELGFDAVKCVLDFVDQDGIAIECFDFNGELGMRCDGVANVCGEIFIVHVAAVNVFGAASGEPGE